MEPLSKINSQMNMKTSSKEEHEKKEQIERVSSDFATSFLVEDEKDFIRVLVTCLCRWNIQKRKYEQSYEVEEKLQILSDTSEMIGFSFDYVYKKIYDTNNTRILKTLDFYEFDEMVKETLNISNIQKLINIELENLLPQELVIELSNLLHIEWTEFFLISNGPKSIMQSHSRLKSAEKWQKQKIHEDIKNIFIKYYS